MRDETHLWNATNCLVEKFSALGGASRYRGMTDEEICRFVACRTLELFGSVPLVQRYVDPRFREQAGDVVNAVDRNLAQIKARGRPLVVLVTEYLAHYEGLLDGVRTNLWESLRGAVREYDT